MLHRIDFLGEKRRQTTSVVKLILVEKQVNMKKNVCVIRKRVFCAPTSECGWVG